MNRYLWPVTAVVCAVIVAIGAIVIARELRSNNSAPAASSGSATPAQSSPVSGGPASGSSGAPASTPSPAVPLTAFTVCMSPVVSCRGEMRTEPSQLLTSGDGSMYVRGISWSGWGNATATGTGTMEIDNCSPNCAQGTFTGYPATITVSNLTAYGGGKQAYADMTITAPAAAGGARSYHHLLP